MAVDAFSAPVPAASPLPGADPTETVPLDPLADAANDGVAAATVTVTSPEAPAAAAAATAAAELGPAAVAAPVSPGTPAAEPPKRSATVPAATPAPVFADAPAALAAGGAVSAPGERSAPIFQPATQPADRDPAGSAEPASAQSAMQTAAPAPDARDQPKPPQAPAQAAPAGPDSLAETSPLHNDVPAASDDPDITARPKLDPLLHLLTPAPAHAASIQGATPQTTAVSAAQPVPLNALAVEIAGQARAGNSRFEIRLDPPELGRIDVRLDIDRDGNVTSRLVIERSDTYDLLRRDQSTLERALQQAGLKTSDNALEFSLRDQGFAHQREAEDRRDVAALIHDTEVPPGEAAQGYARLLGARGGIDIRV